MDIFTPEKRSEIMSRISGKNTKPEVALRMSLHRLGLRYRLHAKELPGKPDIVFRQKKVAIFVDGEWWHGRNYKIESHKYSLFWQEKIQKNIIRDIKVNKELKKKGWKVFRFWQKDLQRSPEVYADKVYRYLKKSRVRASERA